MPIQFPGFPPASGIDLTMMGQPQLPQLPQVQPPIPQQPAPAPGIFDPGGRLDIRNDPTAIMSLLRFAGGAIQPHGPGGSSAGTVGNALADALNFYQSGRKQEAGITAQEKATGIAERGQNLNENKQTFAVKQDTRDAPIKNDYIKALTEAARRGGSKEGAGTGTGGTLGDRDRDMLIAAMMANDSTLTRPQAEEKAIMALATKGANDPSIQRIRMYSDMLASGLVKPEDFPVMNTMVDEAVKQSFGTTVTPADLQVLEKAPDSEIVALAKDPQSRASAEKKYGKAWEARLQKAYESELGKYQSNMKGTIQR